MEDLKSKRCKPQEGQPAMTPPQIDEQLARVAQWALQDGAIEKTYRFANFHETMAFVNALAWVAHAEDHHPDLRLSYNRCVVRYNTHSVGGISINDFICAVKIDALLA